MQFNIAPDSERNSLRLVTGEVEGGVKRKFRLLLVTDSTAEATISRTRREIVLFVRWDRFIRFRFLLQIVRRPVV